MNKKIPMRRCVGCGESKPKQELIRITAREEGAVPDPTGRAYISAREVRNALRQQEKRELSQEDSA